MSYDVIVVGARVGGATTAMLLARAGLRVLCVDQARFPSDTLSTHQLQLPGVVRLAKWGLLDRVLATGVPPTRRVRFHVDDVTIDGRYPSVDGIDAMISPRRTVLDALLVDAAREAGAEIREATIVEDVVFDGGGRAAGVRCRTKQADHATVERASFVIGADGRHSVVARAVAAPGYHAQPPRSIAFYTYWDGLPVDGGEIYGGDGWAVGVWPTNDALAMTYVAQPATQFDRFRRDADQNLLAVLDRAGDLGQRARDAKQVAPTRGTNDLPNYFRQAHGPGWVLVGDAGLAMDPITGLGMGHALRDADHAAHAIIAALDGSITPHKALAAYAKARDRQTRPSYDFTLGVAALKSASDAERQLFRAIANNSTDTTSFFATLSGAMLTTKFFTPARIIRLVGMRGFLALARSRASS